jgi:hypothetical protein
MSFGGTTCALPGALISRSEYRRNHWPLAASRYGSRAPGVQAHCCDSHKTIWVRSTFSSRTPLTRILYPQTCALGISRSPTPLRRERRFAGRYANVFLDFPAKPIAPPRIYQALAPHWIPSTNIDTMLPYSNAYVTLFFLHTAPCVCISSG